MLNSADAAAFARLYRRFRGPILRYVGVRLRDREVAEEVTQEVFVKAFRFRASYRPEHSLSAWLHRIARNTVIDHLRRGAEARGDVAPEDLAHPGHCAEALAIRTEERRRTLKGLRSLPRMQKRVLWMRLVHQLSFAEIAARLGVSLSAAKNLAFRARGASMPPVRRG